MDVHDLIAKGVPRRDIIGLMRKRYPKFTKAAQSMIENPEYGVSLSPAAARYLSRKLNSQSDRRRTAGKLPRILSFRVSDARLDALYAVMQSDGIGTLQELLSAALDIWLYQNHNKAWHDLARLEYPEDFAKIENAAVTTANSDGGKENESPT